MSACGRTAIRRESCVSLAMLLLCLAGCTSPAIPYNSRGVAQFNAGQYDAARAQFLEAAAADPVNADAYYNLASTYHRLDNAAEAERSYWHCLALDPNHAKANHAYVVFLLEQERVNEAYEHVERWQAQSPSNVDATVELAWLERQAGKTDQAQQLLHQAIAVEPRHPRALAELASIYEANHDSERALALYQRALAAQPNHPDLSSKVADLRSSTPGGIAETTAQNPFSPPDNSRGSRDMRYQLR